MCRSVSSSLRFSIPLISSAPSTCLKSTVGRPRLLRFFIITEASESHGTSPSSITQRLFGFNSLSNGESNKVLESSCEGVYLIILKYFQVHNNSVIYDSLHAFGNSITQNYSLLVTHYQVFISNKIVY